MIWGSGCMAGGGPVITLPVSMSLREGGGVDVVLAVAMPPLPPKPPPFIADDVITSPFVGVDDVIEVPGQPALLMLLLFKWCGRCGSVLKLNCCLEPPLL